MPIGAIGAMCLRRAIQGRWIDGVFTGFGAALADLLAAGAFFGLALVAHYLLENQTMLQLVGGIVLIFLGVRMTQAAADHRSRRARPDLALAALARSRPRFRYRLRDDHHQSGNVPGLRRRFRRVGPVRGARRHAVEGRADRRRRLQRLHAVVADADRRGIGHAPHAPMRLLTAINALLGAVVLGFGVFGVLTFLHTIV